MIPVIELKNGECYKFVQLAPEKDANWGDVLFGTMHDNHSQMVPPGAKVIGAGTVGIYKDFIKVIDVGSMSLKLHTFDRDALEMATGRNLRDLQRQTK